MGGESHSGIVREGGRSGIRTRSAMTGSELAAAAPRNDGVMARAADRRKLRRPPRPVERRAAPRRGRGRARDQAAQARSRALLLLPISTACCAARRWSRRKPPARMRAGVTMTTTLLAKDTAHSTRVPGVHRRRRLRHRRDGGRRRFRHGRRSGDLPRAAVGQRTPAGCCATSISPTASRCRSRRARSTATRWRSSPKPASTISPASRSNSICSSWTIRGSRRTTPTWPPQAPEVEPTHAGLPVSHRERASIRSIRSLEILRAASQALGLPLRSLEVELGPSQYEFTFAPQAGLPPPTPWCCSAAA